MFRAIMALMRFLPQALIISVLFYLAYLFIKENKGQAALKLKALIKNDYKFAVFVFYTVLMLTSTIFARGFTNPFTHLIGYFTYDGWGNFNYVGLLNILMFIPYTFLYIIAFTPDKPFQKGLIFTVTTTLFIELYQLLFWVGQFSLADIIHNTIGGIIGIGLWFAKKRLYK